MSRSARDVPADLTSFPRVSGDEPDTRSTILSHTLFSPRERG